MARSPAGMQAWSTGRKRCQCAVVDQVGAAELPVAPSSESDLAPAAVSGQADVILAIEMTILGAR